MSRLLRAFASSPVTWFVIMAIAVLWPSRFLGPLDGAPLDRPLEAIAAGLALPWIFWLGRKACGTRTFQVAVIALLFWKAGTSVIAAQQGLCATFRSPQPLNGLALTMRIEEPRGFLRSWDVRADLWSDEPACTAILTRSLRETAEFPAWFLNITDRMLSRRDVAMRAAGFVSNDTVTPVEYSTTLRNDVWTFDPAFAGGPLWRAGLVTATPPSAVDRWLAPWAWIVAPSLIAVIVAPLLIAAITPIASSPAAIAWIVSGLALALALAKAPFDAMHRASGALTFGALAARVRPTRRSLPAAIWVIGVPWLAFFAAVSVALVGRFSAYSAEDDWLAYQIAGYRIFMNGHWLEAGTPAFDYQPLYRWITGALHLVFGDSSVGEVYWDASALLIGALLAFELTRTRAGYTWGLAAAAMTLATMTLATPWHVIGRGLSEISAAGFGWLAAASLILARDRGASWAGLAAVMAALMFYARLNHLLWAPCLVALLLPPATGCDVASLRAALSRVRWRTAAIYLGGFGAALLAFMTRTYYFTGHFSLFHGTALSKNDTGLRPWTLLDADVWAKVGHSLMGLLFMNEPPRPDVRSAVVMTGALVAILALLPVPVARRIPAALVIVAATGAIGALLAHSHAYPGRFTVHLIPFASALTAIAASTMTSGLTGSDWRVSQSSGT